MHKFLGVLFCQCVCIFKCCMLPYHCTRRFMYICIYGLLYAFTFLPERKKRKRGTKCDRVPLYVVDWRQPMMTCKCMKATAVRNINSRETTVWLFVSVCVVVCRCRCVFLLMWVVALWMHSFQPLPVHMWLCESAFTCMYSSTSASADMSLSACACGSVVLWMLTEDVQHYSSCFIYPLRARLPMKTTGVLTGRSHSMPESVTQH